MKHLFAVNLVILLLIASCKKDTVSKASDPLYGKWQWQYSLTASRDTIWPSVGAVVTLTLNTSHTFSTSLNNSIVENGTFSDSIYANPSSRGISFSNYLLVDRYSGRDWQWVINPSSENLDMGGYYIPDEVGAPVSAHFNKVH